MPRYYYPTTEIKQFKEPQGRGSCYQQFASPPPHGTGDNRFAVIFDEDIDFRVFERIDALFKIAESYGECLNLLAVGERKGELTLVLRNDPINRSLSYLKDLNTVVSTHCSDQDLWDIKLFTQRQFEDFAGHLCHPAITKEAFMEAITWSV